MPGMASSRTEARQSSSNACCTRGSRDWKLESGTTGGDQAFGEAAPWQPALHPQALGDRENVGIAVERAHRLRRRDRRAALLQVIDGGMV